jgi:hypothetical protein
LTCSETSSKRVRPLKDLLSWETVAIRKHEVFTCHGRGATLG